MRPIIFASELKPLLDSAAADIVLLDARAEAGAYEQGHLRGAQKADPNRDLSAASEPGFDPSNGGRHPLPSVEKWATTLGNWGITPSSKVIVYDAQSGANAAARAWWMLRSIGHRDVALLDGGVQAAIDAGIDVTTDTPSIETKPAYPITAWQRPTVDLYRVDALRNDPQWKVLDVRSAERFRGETEPIDPIAGHIPGAVNLPYVENLESVRFKEAAALRALYTRLLDGTSPDHLAVHCGSGVTACHTLLALELAGLEGASLFVGSWGEWCRHPELPRTPEA